ncbi:MAG: hypothetical protein ABI597_13465 [Gammaproteobacteria bacterium]
MKHVLKLTGFIFVCINLFGCVTTVEAPQGGWRCNVHNARGQAWNIRGFDQQAAVNNAMRVCVRNSQYARNCQISNCYMN